MAVATSVTRRRIHFDDHEIIAWLADSYNRPIPPLSSFFLASMFKFSLIGWTKLGGPNTFRIIFTRGFCFRVICRSVGFSSIGFSGTRYFSSEVGLTSVVINYENIDRKLWDTCCICAWRLFFSRAIFATQNFPVKLFENSGKRASWLVKMAA